MTKANRRLAPIFLLMSKLIRMPDDANLIRSKGIVQGDLRIPKHKLPRILRLGPEESVSKLARIMYALVPLIMI